MLPLSRARVSRTSAMAGKATRANFSEPRRRLRAEAAREARNREVNNDHGFDQDFTRIRTSARIPQTSGTRGGEAREWGPFTECRRLSRPNGRENPSLLWRSRRRGRRPCWRVRRVRSEAQGQDWRSPLRSDNYGPSSPPP